MRVILALLVVTGFLLPSFGGPAPPAEDAASHPPAETPSASATGEWTLFPTPESWTNVEPSVIAVIFPVGSHDVDPKNSLLTINERDILLRWNAGNGTLWASPSGDLGEGTHIVSVEVAERGGSSFDIVWAFHLDKTPPILLIFPLPSSVPEESVAVAGEVAERNLENLTVNGVVVTVDTLGRFETAIPLWPGPNDILVHATDRAGNTEGALRTVTRNPGGSEPLSLQEFRHENSSFTIDLPSGWSIIPDPYLETGGTADVVALGPADSRVRPTISVISGLGSTDWAANDLLAFMEGAITNLSRDHQIEVISQPRIVSSGPYSLSGQFSLSQDVDGENATFLLASYRWNGFIPRNWIILASSSVGQVADLWPLFAASTESFQVIGGGEPQEDLASQLRTLVIVVAPLALAASAFIGVSFGVVLYLRRRKKERAVIGESHEDS